MMYQGKTVTRGFQHELYFDSLDRNVASVAWEMLRGCINAIQTQRLEKKETLELFLSPRIQRKDHNATIGFITREEFTEEEQSFIRLHTGAKNPRFNILVEVTLKEISRG